MMTGRQQQQQQQQQQQVEVRSRGVMMAVQDLTGARALLRSTVRREAGGQRLGDRQTTASVAAACTVSTCFTITVYRLSASAMTVLGGVGVVCV